MGENFMTAGTQIEALVDKRNAILEKAAGLVAEATIDRAKNGNLKKTAENDIANLIKGFTEEERTLILQKAVVLIAMNGKFGASQPSNTKQKESRDNRERNDGFRSRSSMFGGWQ